MCDTHCLKIIDVKSVATVGTKRLILYLSESRERAEFVIKNACEEPNDNMENTGGSYALFYVINHIRHRYQAS